MRLIRSQVSLLFQEASEELVTKENCRILDVAPQDHGGIRPFLNHEVNLVTLDINPSAGADIVGDLCDLQEVISNSSFDAVVCTEVLEHVTNPFDAVSEIHRILKPGGRLFASSPFDFRIHGPLPDNWRFSEHGWRMLLETFSNVEIRPLDNPKRFLMPIHYTVFATK